MRVIGVTSPGARDGKTMTAINLAAALAAGSNARVLLIEADLRRPAVSRYLGLGNADRTGLAELVVDSHRQIQDAIERHDQFGFDTMIAGAAETPVHQIFRMPRLQAVLTELRERYDYVVIDTPPVGPSRLRAVARRWTASCRSSPRTMRKQLENALNMLEGAARITSTDDKAAATADTVATSRARRVHLNRPNPNAQRYDGPAEAGVLILPNWGPDHMTIERSHPEVSDRAPASPGRLRMGCVALLTCTCDAGAFRRVFHSCGSRSSSATRRLRPGVC